MSDAQFYILCTIVGTGLGAIAAAIRWGVGTFTSVVKLNTAAMIENTKSNAVLSTKIDQLHSFAARGKTGPVRLIQDLEEP